MDIMSSELWRLSAAQLAAQIAARNVSAVEATESCLARLEAVNPHLNAVVETFAQGALSAAAEADKAVARHDPLGILHGVPVTIKVNVDMERCATTNGVVAFRDLIANEDSPVVANMRRAGAIIIGRTNAPAFSYRWFTDNELYGRTLNPWNAGITPGGSSGGAASAVAAGIGAIAHGNDLGGSIRYPAYACGVAGLRPTSGRVPAFNPSQKADRTIAVQMASVQGPLARTVGDLRLALAAMSSHDGRDVWQQSAPLIGPNTFPCRVAACPEIPGVPTDPAVSDAVRQAARWLEEAGCSIETVMPPHFEEACDLWLNLLSTESLSGLAPTIEQYGDSAIRTAFASQKRLAVMLNLTGYIAALARRTGLLREWEAFFQRYPLLLMPVSAQKPFVIDADQKGDEAMREVIAAQAPLTSTAILGLPGLSVPTGVAGGVPMGVQLIGGRFQEHLILAAGEAIEMKAGTGTPVEPAY